MQKPLSGALLALGLAIACHPRRDAPAQVVDAAVPSPRPPRAPVGTPAPSVAPAPAAPSRDALSAASLRATVEALAAPSMRGREPESPEDQAVRSLLEGRFRAAGLSPAEGGFQRPFVYADHGDQVATANVVAVWGAAPSSPRADEVVVVGAHHDHLGSDRRRIFAGANDNASGVSVLLGVAEDLASRGVRLRRAVVFVAFGGEEDGLRGSQAYVRAPPAGLPMARTRFMLNLDMVGTWSADRCLYALHTFPGTPGRTALDALAPSYPDLRVQLGEPGDDSDHLRFDAVGVPTTFFYTPDPRCYHRPCDTPARLEYDALSRIARLARDLVVSVANADDLTPARGSLRPRRSGRGS